MIVPIVDEQGAPENAVSQNEASEKGFAIVAEFDPFSPRERFERRAAEIAEAAEIHVRRMVDEESKLLAARPVSASHWTVDPESRDTVPFGLKRRVVIRVPLFRSEEPRPDNSVSELQRIRALMAQLALDLIGQVIEINRYFADAGLVPSPVLPRDQDPGRDAAGNTMSGGSAGSSFRRRA